MSASGVESAHDAAFRVLLKQLSPTPAVLIARASCVCSAWRAAASTQPALDCGSAPSSAVASLLSSCAEKVEELILDKWTAASLPPSVQSLPRLSRVRETRHEPRRGAECLPLLRAAPNLTHWLIAGVDGEVSMLALVCGALCDTDARPGVDTLLEYRCHALCQLHSEFAGFLAKLAKDGLLDKLLFGALPHSPWGVGGPRSGCTDHPSTCCA